MSEAQIETAELPMLELTRSGLLYRARIADVMNHNNIPVAIVGCRPDCDQLFIEHELVAFHDKLMCPCNKLHFIGLAEMLADVASKQVACTSRTQTPAFYVLGITPQQITHCAIMRHFLFSVYCADLHIA